MLVYALSPNYGDYMDATKQKRRNYFLGFMVFVEYFILLVLFKQNFDYWYEMPDDPNPGGYLLAGFAFMGSLAIAAAIFLNVVLAGLMMLFLTRKTTCQFVEALTWTLAALFLSPITALLLVFITGVAIGDGNNGIIIIAFLVGLYSPYFVFGRYGLRTARENY